MSNEHKEFRNKTFKKLEDIMNVACESVEKEPNSPHKHAMLYVLANVGRLFETLRNVKSDEAFLEVSKGIDALLEEQFFAKIYGLRPGYQKNKDLSAIPTSKPNEEKKPESGFNIKTVVVDGNVDELPYDVRLKLAQSLKAMGVPEEELNKQLNLGGF